MRLGSGQARHRFVLAHRACRVRGRLRRASRPCGSRSVDAPYRGAYAALLYVMVS